MILSSASKTCLIGSKTCRGTPRIKKQIYHGYSQSKIYRCWRDMIQRCYNPKSQSYKNYGGRGIEVCEEWQSFGNFYKDMGDRPEGMSLDRIDNDGNYEPDNCKWSTVIEQLKNRRTWRRYDNALRAKGFFSKKP